MSNSGVHPSGDGAVALEMRDLIAEEIRQGEIHERVMRKIGSSLVEYHAKRNATLRAIQQRLEASAEIDQKSARPAWGWCNDCGHEIESGGSFTHCSRCVRLADALHYLGEERTSRSSLEARVKELEADKERIDAIERGDVEVACMGTTFRYFNAWTPSSNVFTTADGYTKRDLRRIIDDALADSTAASPARLEEGERQTEERA